MVRAVDGFTVIALPDGSPAVGPLTQKLGSVLNGGRRLRARRERRTSRSTAPSTPTSRLAAASATSNVAISDWDLYHFSGGVSFRRAGQPLHARRLLGDRAARRRPLDSPIPPESVPGDEPRRPTSTSATRRSRSCSASCSGAEGEEGGDVMSETGRTRIEHDLLGDKAVPADAYYGVQTARALENFHISGVELRLYPNLIKAFAMVKLAAARANFDCGQFSQRDPEGHRGRLPGAHRRQAPRPVPARRLPGRRRHLDEHERQRGDRQPRARADGPPQGRVRALQPARPRQRLAVHERRLPDVAARRHGARQRAARRGDEGADRRVPREGQGVRLRS